MKRSRKAYSDPTFVLLPKQVLKHPPIAHRGRPSAGLLAPFAMAVLAALVAAARSVGLADERHRYALEHGHNAMQRKRAKYNEKDKNRRNDMFREEGAGLRNKHIGSIGKAVYKLSRRNFGRSQRPAAITMTRATLLKQAGLSRKASNYSRLDATLKRLRQPVQAGPEQLPPPLESVRRLLGGKLRLYVDEAWLPHDIGKVAMPLPTKGNGTVTLALYLFAAGTDQRSTHAMGHARMRTQELCRRIGISMTSKHWVRALDNAVARVNAHLRDLGLSYWYDIAPLPDGKWVHLYYRETSDGETSAHQQPTICMTDIEYHAMTEDSAEQRYRRSLVEQERRQERDRRLAQEVRRNLGLDQPADKQP